MEQRLDITNLIEKNPLTRLNKFYENKFIQKIQQNFTENQHHIFLASFYTTLNYNQKTDFVIEFDSTWKWLEYSRKEECKRVLVKHFVEGVDYKIVLRQAAENLDAKKIHEEKAAPEIGGAAIESSNLGGAGLNKETILLSVRTFKKLALKSKTKKADEIHEYFIKMEEIFQEVIDEESNELRIQLSSQKQQLSNKQFELEQKELELKKEQKTKNWLINRRYQHEEPKQCVYLYKDNDDYKIGKSEKGVAERERAYSNMSPNGEIIYFQNCLNCNLTEKVLHHTLDKYRTIRNREWFNFSEELAIKTIKSIIYIMDFQMETVDEFFPKLYTMLEIKDEKVVVEKVVEEKVEVQVKVNPKDFERFINECCELSPDYNHPKADIKMAHRIWSKCTSVTKELNVYLEDTFKSGVIMILNVMYIKASN